MLEVCLKAWPLESQQRQFLDSVPYLDAIGATEKRKSKTVSTAKCLTFCGFCLLALLYL